MAKGIGGGIAVAGFPFIVLGFVFLVSRNAGIGIPFLMFGLCCIAAGMWGARKTPPPNGDNDSN